MRKKERERVFTAPGLRMLKRKRAIILDENSLSCEACLLPLAPPIYQCTNGHCMCSLCGDTLEGKCHTCSSSIDKSFRNLGLERILNTLKRRCMYARYGCDRMLLCCESQVHEKKCWYWPHNCPLPGCWFHGSLHDMSSHFETCHKVRSVKFMYNEQFRVDVALNEQYVLLLGPDELFLFCCRNCHQLGKLLYVSSFCFTSQAVASSTTQLHASKASPSSSSSPPSSPSPASSEHDVDDISSAYQYKLDFVCYKGGNRLAHIFSTAVIEKNPSTSSCVDCGTLPRDFLILPKPYLKDRSEIFVSIESPSWPPPSSSSHQSPSKRLCMEEIIASFDAPSSPIQKG